MLSPGGKEEARRLVPISRDHGRSGKALPSRGDVERYRRIVAKPGRIHQRSPRVVVATELYPVRGLGRLTSGPMTAR
jgi:hypothetical protein